MHHDARLRKATPTNPEHRLQDLFISQKTFIELVGELLLVCFSVKMVNSCMVQGCSVKARKGQQVSFHYLPKDTERCKQWLRVINHPYYSEHTPAEYLKKLKVCSLHFKKEDFQLNVLGMKRVALLDSAIPSVFTFPEDDEQPGPSGLSSAKRIRLEVRDFLDYISVNIYSLLK